MSNATALSVKHLMHVIGWVLTKLNALSMFSTMLAWSPKTEWAIEDYVRGIRSQSGVQLYISEFGMKKIVM